MKNLEEKEYNNIYAIPANYTDSGKIFGGMLELRNTIEAALIVIIIGYPELMLIPMATTLRIVVMTVTLIPVAVIALMLSLIHICKSTLYGAHGYYDVFRRFHICRSGTSVD